MALNTFNWTVPAGSTQTATFIIQNPDGTPYPITGATWEYVIRLDPEDTSATPLAKVTTVANAQGVLTVNTSTSTVVLTLNPAATATLPINPTNPYAHSLWMNPATTTALLWVTGQFLLQRVAQP